MSLAPIPLSDAAALLIDGAGWITVTPGTMQFIQQAIMADETGNPVPLPEPWVQWVAPAGDPALGAPAQPQPCGFPWRAVLGVKLAAPAEPLG